MAQHDHDVGTNSDWQAQTIRQVEVDGTPVLLIRDGEAIHAVAGTCPHAGGPLAQGAYHDGRIICPWHKATFCIRTGAVLEPPAVDALRRFDVRVEADRIRLSEPAPPVEQPAGADSRCFVIIGGGAAGALAAQTLRQEGFAGRVVILDRENRVPYDRTVLSKYFLSGENDAEKSPLQAQSFYRAHGIERLTAEVTRVDAAERRITCADGFVLNYDAALIATGGAPTRPPLPGADGTDVFLLRTRTDADRILARAERSERAVVLGASFIGMEVAASLRECGLDVTVAAQQQAPFAKQLGARIGTVFTRLHEKRGVSFRFGQDVAAIEDDRDGKAVVLASDERLKADFVIIGFGVQPVTDFLHGVARNQDGSLTVDVTLRAAEGLFAAGDVARFPLRGDGTPIRVEHWRVAEQHGHVAALNMLGRAVRYDAVPVFWTIQYLKRLDYIGHAEDWDDIVVHGDLEKPEFIAYYVKDGRVVTAVGLDRDRDTAALVELLTICRDWTPEALGPEPASILGRMAGT
jgi:NADPH-dependent 2,4-dienoyl-CoA reductase/sulfur reductase-like enzyme/nitrite reductase/ring-hydroxylating ferredoxin subunit